ncbi:MAG: DUF2089 domain-containing protein [Anaerolineae bacterium]|nr:DUF2089 domain-containing protein [Anaerolineae bacterium]
MHPVLGACPVCGEPLTITRLHCRACDTSIEGQFYAGRLAQLSPRQLEFVETFLLCEGKIKAVEERLGISYPTVRSRLRDVIMAMGYEMQADDESEPPLSEGDRKRVLDDLAAGRLSSEEAIAMLKGLGE